MDKRTESQFKKPKPIDLGENVPDIKFGYKGEEPSSIPFMGSAGDRMQAMAKIGKETPDSTFQVGKNKPTEADTKSGRRELAKQLGLPNVKKKKGK